MSALELLGSERIGVNSMKCSLLVLINNKLFHKDFGSSVEELSEKYQISKAKVKFIRKGSISKVSVEDLVQILVTAGFKVDTDVNLNKPSKLLTFNIKVK